MSYASIVMVKCPTTGREISTGVEMDAATLNGFPIFTLRSSVPFAVLITTGQRAKLGSAIQLRLFQRSPGCSSTIKVRRTIRPAGGSQLFG